MSALMTRPIFALAGRLGLCGMRSINQPRQNLILRQCGKNATASAKSGSISDTFAVKAIGGIAKGRG